MLDRSSTRYVLILWCSDIVLTIFALVAAAWVRPILPFGKELEALGGRLLPEIFLFTGIVWTVIMAMASAYDARRMVRARGEAKAVFVGVSQSTLILAGALYLTFRGLSRLLFVTFYAFDLVFLLAARMGLRLLMKATSKRPMQANRVLIVGTNKTAQALGETVKGLRWMGLELLGFVASSNGHMVEDNDSGETASPVLGTMAAVPALVREHAITEIIIAVPLHASEALPDLVAQLSELPVNIKIVPDVADLVFFRSTIEELGGIPLIGIKEPVLSPSARLVKRLLDLSVAMVVFVLLSPLMALIAVLVKLDSAGPVVFRQQRVGEGQRLFWMYKFRTMVDQAVEMEPTLIQYDDRGDVIFAKRPDDPRVTKIGRFLRHYSLDELLQLVNVIKGEMSLVGPRPELPLVVENYQPWQRKRFAVPPGMTGWWQVRGRSQQPMSARTEDDLYYIQNYSLLLDLNILWKTVPAVFSGRGAF